VIGYDPIEQCAHENQPIQLQYFWAWHAVLGFDNGMGIRSKQQMK
jgi:hypothetical protein